MPTPEERLTTLDKTVALLKRSSDASIQELSRNVTMLLGIVSAQQWDIKEIKISLVDIEERLDGMNGRFDGVDKRLDAMDRRFDGIDKRLDAMDQHLSSLDKKFDQVLVLLTKLANNTQ